MTNRVHPNYDLYRLALRSTAQRDFILIIAMLIGVLMKVMIETTPRTYMSTMGCRTYNGYDINAEPGVPQMKDRGNLAPVTIILPTLAMMAKEKLKKQILI